MAENSERGENSVFVPDINGENFALPAQRRENFLSYHRGCGVFSHPWCQATPLLKKITENDKKKDT